jgi:hypothetical protein
MYSFTERNVLCPLWAKQGVEELQGPNVQVTISCGSCREFQILPFADIKAAWLDGVVQWQSCELAARGLVKDQEYTVSLNSWVALFC